MAMNMRTNWKCLTRSRTKANTTFSPDVIAHIIGNIVTDEAERAIVSGKSAARLGTEHHFPHIYTKAR